MGHHIEEVAIIGVDEGEMERTKLLHCKLSLERSLQLVLDNNDRPKRM